MTPKRKARVPARRAKTLVRIAAAALVLVVLAELVVERHPYFDFDRPFGFYAWFGFGAGVAMVLVATLLGRILKRPDDYYRD